MECKVPGTMAITFDDGPYLYTDDLLDILAEYDVSATFFINGKNIGRSLDRDKFKQKIVKRAYSEGHQIGSHTWSHRDLSVTKGAAREQQMTELEDTLIDIIGVKPTYMRPPYGSCDAQCMAHMANMGYRVIHWSLDTLDYGVRTVDEMNVVEESFEKKLPTNTEEPGPIVLAHDSLELTVYQLAVPMIEKSLEAGFQLVTVGECLGESRRLWYKRK
ncbi:Chitin deacetylase [Ceratocystis fimbriata CBS 114723]|uniref:Chitin deacetylase n=1 Tax=Ceratocystis fimbriata CBS 114723 TaxID=1035309 RepID=A0A2C5X2C1_9PEZI|nr:Chitin deacetylase [Ceratocystis fimbriata CBS 114723]